MARQSRDERDNWHLCLGHDTWSRFASHISYGPQSFTGCTMMRQTQSSSRHIMPQSSGKLFDARSIAWHPTLKSGAIYATAEIGEPAVHLISAKRHRFLMTWTPKQLTGIPAESLSKSPPRLAWSPDGNKLAISNSNGAVILRFRSVRGHSHEALFFLFIAILLPLLIVCVPVMLLFCCL